MNIRINNKTCKVLYFEVCPINGYEIIKVIPEIILRKTIHCFSVYDILNYTAQKLDIILSKDDHIINLNEYEEYYLFGSDEDDIPIKILTIAIRTSTGGIQVYSFDRETLEGCEIDDLRTEKVIKGIPYLPDDEDRSFLDDCLDGITSPQKETLRKAGIITYNDLWPDKFKIRLKSLKGIGKRTIDRLMNIHEMIHYLDRYEIREA